MYDIAELRHALDGLWRAISVRMPNAPAVLDREGDVERQWLDRGLVLGQTCGWPLVERLAPDVTVVGAFSYRGIEETPGPWYRSVLVARDDQPLDSFAGRTAAVNGWESLSGWVSLAHGVAPHAAGRPFFGDVVVTGDHAASVAAVLGGDADLASVDAVTFALLARYQPSSVDGVTVVGGGPLVPTLPLITASSDPRPIRDAIVGAMADGATAGYRDSLLIEEFFPLDQTDYEPLKELRAAAEDLIPPDV